MSSYLGRHAELYDCFYSDKPYEQEAAFVHGCLTKYGLQETRHLLEVACGTGSHAFALEKFGYEIRATDYSDAMLEVAQQKAQQKGSGVRFSKADMTNLESVDGTFDAAYSMFDSVGYVLTNERLEATFKQIRKLLKTGGVFVFEFWHAAAMISRYDPVRIRTWNTADGRLVRISETSLDIARQTSEVRYSIYELRNNGTYDYIQETQTNRYFLVQEMSYLLTSCGFEPVKWFSGFSDSEVIDEQTWHVLAVARARANNSEAV